MIYGNYEYFRNFQIFLLSLSLSLSLSLYLCLSLTVSVDPAGIFVVVAVVFREASDVRVAVAPHSRSRAVSFASFGFLFEKKNQADGRPSQLSKRRRPAPRPL